jgi:hypothetical protein
VGEVQEGEVDINMILSRRKTSIVDSFGWPWSLIAIAPKGGAVLAKGAAVAATSVLRHKSVRILGQN